MSRDIHFHTEIKIGGKWEHYSQPRIPQVEPLFAYLLQGPFLRGLPVDRSYMTEFCARYEQKQMSTHSYGFITSDEVKALEVYIRDLIRAGRFKCSLRSDIMSDGHILGYIFGNSWSDFRDVNGVEDVRFLFWFDC